MTIKAAFIGPKVLFESFQNDKPDWDFQAPLLSIKEFDDDLAIEEPYNKIARETSVIIFFSRLFEKERAEFSDLVAYLAPNSVTCILIPESDKSTWQKEIQNSVRQRMDFYAREDDTYNANTPFFFVTYENAFEEVEESILNYYNSPLVDPEIKKAIKDIVNTTSTTEQSDELNDLFNEDEVDNSFSYNTKEGGGEVIVSTSSKGGSGKSTVAVTTANALSLASIDAVNKGERERPLRICMVDFDVWDGQLGIIHNAMKPTIVNIFADYEEGKPLSEEDVKKGIYHHEPTNIDVIPATRKPRNAKAIPTKFYFDLVGKLKEMYDYIFLDTSVRFLDPLLTDVAYPYADKVIFVTDMGAPSVHGMTRWIDESVLATDREHTIDPNKVGVVINRAIKDSGLKLEDIEKAARELPIISVVPNAPNLITNATNRAKLEEILMNQSIRESFDNVLDFILKDDEIVGEITL